MAESLLKMAESSMEKVILFISDEFKNIRTSGVSPGVLSRVVVDYYGVPTPVNQIAAISTQDAQTLVISPWDVSIINKLEKAILKSDIGVNPNNDGKIIRLAFPILSQERREELTKEVSKLAEEAKVNIRNIRHDFLSKIKVKKKNNEISLDEINRYEKKIQNMVDNYVSKIDNLKEEKNKKIIS